MSNQPIYVTIKDACNVGRSLTWLAKGAKWMSPGGSVVLDYDPWSCASDTQRARIASAIDSGSVTMTINVLNDAGEYIAVPYCPGKAPKAPFIAPEQPAAPAQRPAAVAAKPAPVFKQTDNGTHTVVAGVNKVAAKYGISSTVVTPPAGTPDSYGFSTTDDAAPAEAASGFDKKAAIAAEKEAAVEPAAEPPVQAGAEQPAADLSDEDRFNALLAEKKWTEAHKLLKAHFGDARITFSQRALQYVTDWAALVAKYGLDE